MAVYREQDEAHQRRIVQALLNRIGPSNEYTAIGYFFLLSLFRMGELGPALRTIRTRLPDAPKYSFDDAVMMLSGLLQYEYPSFDDGDLDEVERFMEGLEGHIHHLKERCVAARAIGVSSRAAPPEPL